MDDIDIVGDLNDGTADFTPATSNNGDVPAHGDNARSPNDPVLQEAPKPAPQPKAEEKPAAEKPLSLREQISQAIKGDNATPPAALQDGGPPRNANGTFAPKPVEPAADAPKPLAAPAGIDAQVFSSLPAETQATLARTMEDVNSRQQRIAWLEPLEQVITQERINAWAMAGGMQPAQAVHQLLALSDFAGRDPAGFIKYIAQENGVDLEELVLGMEPVEPVDPAIKALQDEIAELRGFTTRQTQEQQASLHNRTVDAVVAFASEKGEDGSLLRPHFEELGATIMPYISMVKEQNPTWPHNQVLQEAYDRACWGTPAVRSKLQQTVNAAGEAERLRAEAARVEKARTASASVRSGAPTSAPVAPNDPSRTLRDTIKASIAQHS
jgi:hypothetical protein